MLNKIKILLLSSLMAFPQSLLASESGNEVVVKEAVEVFGDGFLFAEDTDIILLGILDPDMYKELSSVSNENNVYEDSSVVRVKIASVKPLTKREAGSIDLFNERAFGEVNKYSDKNVSYACNGYEYIEGYGDLLSCNILINNSDLGLTLIEKGFAYYEEESSKNSWMHDDYVNAQKKAKLNQFGIWEPKL